MQPRTLLLLDDSAMFNLNKKLIIYKLLETGVVSETLDHVSDHDRQIKFFISLATEITGKSQEKSTITIQEILSNNTDEPTACLQAHCP